MAAGLEALDAWVLATWPQAVAYAASLLHDRAAAEDVVQECFCNLLRKAAVYDLPRDGTKLLYRSVTNACIKKNTREPHLLSLAALGDDGEAWVEDDAAGPVGHVMTRELERAVGEALDRLPAVQRAALELKSLGHSLQEIADALEISAANAGVLVHRARRAMAAYLSAWVKEDAG